MSDKIKNYYSKLSNSETNKPKLDKNYIQHYILPCSMICFIGATGTGKSTVLCDFLLDRKNSSFYEVIIFNPVNLDEPIYNFLYDICPDIQLINDIEDLPELKELDTNKKQEKLLVVDDFIALSSKDMKKIEKYLISSRKYGFTVILLAQNYTSIPKVISRNISYWFIFKCFDNVSINTIIRNHNIYNIDKEYIMKCYLDATKVKKDFFMFDCNVNSDKDHSLRHNFTEFYSIK